MQCANRNIVLIALVSIPLIIIIKIVKRIAFLEFENLQSPWTFLVSFYCIFSTFYSLKIFFWCLFI